MNMSRSVYIFQSFQAGNHGQYIVILSMYIGSKWPDHDLIGVITNWETKYFEKEPVQQVIIVFDLGM